MSPSAPEPACSDSKRHNKGTSSVGTPVLEVRAPDVPHLADGSFGDQSPSEFEGGNPPVVETHHAENARSLGAVSRISHRLCLRQRVG
jgi:hypothetical protein